MDGLLQVGLSAYLRTTPGMIRSQECVTYDDERQETEQSSTFGIHAVTSLSEQNTSCRTSVWPAAIGGWPCPRRESPVKRWFAQMPISEALLGDRGPVFPVRLGLSRKDYAKFNVCNVLICPRNAQEMALATDVSSLDRCGGVSLNSSLDWFVSLDRRSQNSDRLVSREQLVDCR